MFEQLGQTTCLLFIGNIALRCSVFAGFITPSFAKETAKFFFVQINGPNFLSELKVLFIRPRSSTCGKHVFKDEHPEALG